MDTRTRVRTIIPLSALTLALLMAGCTGAEDVEPAVPQGAPAAPSASPVESASPVVSASPIDTEYSYMVPGPQDGERARAVFEEDGPDGIPTTTVTAVAPLTAGESAIVTGACVGDSVDFVLATATPSPETLLAGTIECSWPGAGFRYQSIEYTGAVQLSFTDTDDATDAWAVFAAETAQDG